MTHQETKRANAHKIAKIYQAREPSDPFVYRRVFTHCMNKVGEPSYLGEPKKSESF